VVLHGRRHVVSRRARFEFPDPNARSPEAARPRLAVAPGPCSLRATLRLDADSEWRRGPYLAACQMKWLMHSKRKRQPRGSAAIALLCVVLVAGPTHGAAEYTLDSGDILDISVYRSPDLSKRAKVDLDGNIIFLPLGAIRAEGLTIREIRSQIQQELVRKDVVREPEVAVELVEARPFYISGDVAKPGSYPYISGLTVRRAAIRNGKICKDHNVHLSSSPLLHPTGGSRSTIVSYEPHTGPGRCSGIAPMAARQV